VAASRRSARPTSANAGSPVNSRAKRVPDLTWHEPTSPTFEQAARSWRAALVDVADSTREQHRIQLNKLLPLIGNRRIDTLTAEDFIDVVAQLHANGTARETIRKTLGAGAMALDLAGIDPNPARDRSIKLPWEEPEQISPRVPPTSRRPFLRIPTEHRLALLWLDWSGARVSRVDLTLMGDFDGRASAFACAPPRPRPAGRSGSSYIPRSPRRSRQRCPTGASAIPRRACSPTPAPMPCTRRSARPAKPLGYRSGRRTTCATGGSRCYTCAVFPGRASPSSSGSASCRSRPTPIRMCSSTRRSSTMESCSRRTVPDRTVLHLCCTWGPLPTGLQGASNPTRGARPFVVT
jgi:hypothetical protein